MTDELPTSALLRQTQASLAASQADLTRVETERDEALEAARSLVGTELSLRAELAKAREELERERQVVGMLRKNDEIRAQVIRERNTERNLNRAELASARQELALLRARFGDLVAQSSWIVARDGGRDCLFCDGEIQRGEAYELVPGEGPDALRHVHCPGSSPPPPCPVDRNCDADHGRRKDSPPNPGAGPREDHR